MSPLTYYPSSALIQPFLPCVPLLTVNRQAVFPSNCLGPFLLWGFF